MRGDKVFYEHDRVAMNTNEQASDNRLVTAIIEMLLSGSFNVVYGFSNRVDSLTTRLFKFAAEDNVPLGQTISQIIYAKSNNVIRETNWIRLLAFQCRYIASIVNIQIMIGAAKCLFY